MAHARPFPASAAVPARAGGHAGGARGGRGAAGARPRPLPALRVGARAPRPLDVLVPARLEHLRHPRRLPGLRATVARDPVPALQGLVAPRGLVRGGAMITGAHSIVYSRSPEKDRAFLRDVIGLPHVDAGEGWLIFGLPPAEVAVHPHDEN